MWTPVWEAAGREPPTTSGDHTLMRGRKNPPLEIRPVPEGTPVTFDIMAQAYLEDYVLQRYRTLNTARPRVEHLRDVLWRVVR